MENEICLEGKILGIILQRKSRRVLVTWKKEGRKDREMQVVIRHFASFASLLRVDAINFSKGTWIGLSFIQ